MDFHVKVQVDEGRLVIVVSGELDEASGAELRTLVDAGLADDHEVIVFDLAGVSFMDSRGLGQLLSACRAVETAGHRAHVARPSVHAERVLDSAGLSQRLREPGVG